MMTLVRWITVVSAVSCLIATSTLSGVESQTSIEEILQEVPLIDGHNDLPWQMYLKTNNVLEGIDLYDWPEVHTDINRLRQGMVGGQFWAVYVSCNTQYRDAVRACLDQVDVVYKFVENYTDAFMLATSVADIWTAFNSGRVASLLGMEGGHCIDSSLATLRMFYELGVRYMTITHSCNTPWADGSPLDDTSSYPGNGLTDFGRTLIKEMNRLGMLVDLSHVSHQTMLDVLNITEAPVIFSHSSVYNFCNHHRNVRDDVLNLTKENNGLVMVNFYNNFLTCSNNATIDDVIQHIEYIRDLIGVDHVGLGSDYDGVDNVPEDLEDVSKFPDLLQLLQERGWSDEDLKKIAGLNLLRVFEAAENVAARLQHTTLPSEDIIEDTELLNRTCRYINGSTPLSYY